VNDPMGFLLAAARTDPVLMQACREVEAKLAAAEAELAEARERLARAAHLVSHLVQQVPEFTGVIGPGGEREDDYIRDGIGNEAAEWADFLARTERAVTNEPTIDLS
jgi:hypothetical protein